VKTASNQLLHYALRLREDDAREMRKHDLRCSFSTFSLDFHKLICHIALRHLHEERETAMLIFVLIQYQKRVFARQLEDDARVYRCDLLELITIN
jgi:hypothetical protein